MESIESIESIRENNGKQEQCFNGFNSWPAFLFSLRLLKLLYITPTELELTGPIEASDLHELVIGRTPKAESSSCRTP